MCVIDSLYSDLIERMEMQVFEGRRLSGTVWTDDVKETLMNQVINGWDMLGIGVGREGL